LGAATSGDTRGTDSGTACQREESLHLQCRRGDHLPATKDALYGGGPNRAYNQFYAAMKSWGRYELVSAPADADLVFEIGFTDKYEGQIYVAQFKLVVVEPKTHIALRTITKYVELAGKAKNREKNYDLTMTALMDDPEERCYHAGKGFFELGRDRRPRPNLGLRRFLWFASTSPVRAEAIILPHESRTEAC
jgi:hypothetical protein